MRLTRLAAPIVVLMSLGVAGCGAAQVTVQEAPGGAGNLSVPGNSQVLNPDASATATPNSSSSTTASTDPASTSQSSASTSPAATPVATATATPTPVAGTAGGGTAAPTATPAGSTPPSGDSTNAQQFEAYCAQNPGAC